MTYSDVTFYCDFDTLLRLFKNNFKFLRKLENVQKLDSCVYKIELSK